MHDDGVKIPRRPFKQQLPLAVAGKPVQCAHQRAALFLHAAKEERLGVTAVQMHKADDLGLRDAAEIRQPLPHRLDGVCAHRGEPCMAVIVGCAGDGRDGVTVEAVVLPCRAIALVHQQHLCFARLRLRCHGTEERDAEQEQLLVVVFDCQCRRAQHQKRRAADIVHIFVRLVLLWQAAHCAQAGQRKPDDQRHADQTVAGQERRQERPPETMPMLPSRRSANSK